MPPIRGTTPRVVTPPRTTPTKPTTLPSNPITPATTTPTPAPRDVLDRPQRPMLPGVDNPVIKQPSIPTVPTGPIPDKATQVNAEGVKIWNFTGPGPTGSHKVSLAWDNPKTNSDGSPATNFAGIKIYFGFEHGVYSHVIDVGNVNKFEITGLPDNVTFHCQATSYDTAGHESTMSNEAENLIK